MPLVICMLRARLPAQAGLGACAHADSHANPRRYGPLSGCHHRCSPCAPPLRTGGQLRRREFRQLLRGALQQEGCYGEHCGGRRANRAIRQHVGRQIPSIHLRAAYTDKIKVRVYMHVADDSVSGGSGYRCVARSSRGAESNTTAAAPTALHGSTCGGTFPLITCKEHPA